MTFSLGGGCGGRGGSGTTVILLLRSSVGTRRGEAGASLSDSLLRLHVDDAMEKREASLNLSVLELSAVERRLRFFLLGASFQRQRHNSRCLHFSEVM